MIFFNNCKDPTINMLKSKGYSVVRLPKADLRPTQLVARKGKTLQRLGELGSVFIANPAAPAPPISGDNPSTGIAGQRSADLDIGVGLSVLGGLISALGGSTLGLNASYKSAKKVQFEFTDTLENNMQVALLDQFLAGATVNPFARAVLDMLNADAVYVLTSTIKSKKIKVDAKDQSGTSIGVDVPVIQGAVGGNLKVGAASAGQTVVTYEGLLPLVFGFQAVQLIFDNGQYRTMNLSDAGSLVLEAVQGDDDHVYFDEGVATIGD